MLFAAITPGIAQIAPAGTDIVNQAVVHYSDGTNALFSNSNQVNTRVLPIFSIRLSPPGTVAAPAYALSGGAGDTLYCSFDLDNLGNAADSLAVSFALPAPVAWAPSAVIIFFDADGDGKFDAGEEDPSPLALAQGATVALDVAVVVPPGAQGDAFVELVAVSVNDAGAADGSVIRVSASPASSLLHVGPAGNPRALPGGDGSSDDVTVGPLGYSDVTWTFENDVLNEAPVPQQVEIVLPDVAAIAPDVVLSVADSAGAIVSATPSNQRRFVLGAIPPGATRRFQVVVTSTSGEPLCKLPPPALAIPVTARSLSDSLQRNSTLDRLAPPQVVNPAAAIALRQAFHETVASAGDVVTLVVTVENITDSLRVDSIAVGEFVQPQLSFVSSPDFIWDGARLTWSAGSLVGGEAKKATLKFVANSRVRVGKARAVGRVDGVAETGDAVSAGPVISSIKLDNDVFGDEGVVLGDVFVDADGNGRRGPSERGVANVAIYLESGEYAVTDSTGLFSIPRVFGGYRMVRLDESGLPPGTYLPTTGSRRPNERLVHLLPGGHARVSFPLLERTEVSAPAQEPDAEEALSVQEKVSQRKHERAFRAGSLPSSYFAVGKALAGSGVDQVLEPVVTFLRENPGWKLIVEGHTDNLPINTPEFPSNDELSLARAEAVRNHVCGSGIDHHRVFVRGYGDTRPVASNETIEGRRNNRRVELSFVPPGVNVGSNGEVDRVSAAIRAFDQLPDTYHTTVFWQLATGDETPRDMTLALSPPPSMHARDVSVEAAGVPAPFDGIRHHVSGFSRGAPVHISVDLTCAALDTAQVRDLALAVTLDGEPVTIYPFQAGRSDDATTSYDAMRWSRRRGPASPLVQRGEPAPVFASSPDAVGARAVSFVEPLDARVFRDRDRIRVRASVPLGTHTRLLVDGEPVPESRIGQRTVDVNRGEEQIVWYGVQIRPGWNLLSLESRLLDGGLAADTVRVALSSRTASVRAVRDRVLVQADGRATEAIAFDVTDKLGLPVADGIVADVVEGESLVDAADERPDARGLQVLTRGGRITLHTKPHNDTARGTVVVRCDGFEAGVDVSFVSARKPLFATGVVDVRMSSGQITGDGSGAGVEGYHDGLDVQADSRLFVQGAMPHGLSLTARLDSRRRYDDPLLKDINADRQYPVFGDASSLHFAAPSQGGNYVSVDRDESFVRYGDFRTPLDGGEFLSYRRASTGVTSALVRGRSSFASFVTRTDFSTHQDELPADGTSGFYYLTRSPVVEHSEQIVLETRDRFRSEKVLEVRPVIRNRDYTINYFDGSVLFKEPVAAVDRDFNPVTIVATYEVETSEDAQYLYGARANLADGATYRVGSTAVARSGDGQGYALYGADGELHVGAMRLSGEVARSDDDATGGGNAFKVEAAFEDDIQRHEVYLRRVDGDFNNPSFRGGGTELSSLKSGFQSGISLGPDIRFEADGFVHRLDRTGEQKENLRFVTRYRHTALRILAGGRVARHKQPQGDDNAMLGIAGVAVGDEDAGRAGVSTVWEKNITGEFVEDYPDRLKTRAALPLGRRLTLLGSHEYLTASGRGGSHQATAGVESRIGDETTAYTRYSMNRTAGDERMGAITGLRHRLPLGYGVAAMLGAEAFRSLSDRPDDEYVTLKSGLDARAPGRYLVEGQYEYRWQTRRTKHLVRLNAARQLQNGFAALLKNVLSVSPDALSDDGVGLHSNLAVAHRPPAGAVHSLWMLRNDYERYTPVDPEAITWRLVFSSDVNLMPAGNNELRVKYAFKHVENWSYGASQSVNADLILGQYVYRFARGWDADLWGRLIRQRDGGSMEAGSGLEVGRTFLGALRVAAGYSVNGFEDPDFAGTDAWASGFGVRLQLLLSDWLLDELQGEPR